MTEPVLPSLPCLPGVPLKPLEAHSDPNSKFKLISDYRPAGDQPEAIKSLIKGIEDNDHNQVLLGVTGSGKTFTIAQVIQTLNRPSLVLAPNKTLAAQLYGEMKSFFPENAVEYFVSYYDYYQPEAYVPRSDTFIEKESSINEQIDRLRHAATRAMLERRDVVVVASVSCIYGIGSVETYSGMVIHLKAKETVDIQKLSRRLVELQYTRNEISFHRGTFRISGDVMEIFPSHLEDRAWRLSFFGDELEYIYSIDPLTGQKIYDLEEIRIFPNSHYVTPHISMPAVVKKIRADLKERVAEFESQNKLLESQRLLQRTTFDLEMMEATGFCPGIENYSRYLSGRPPGAPPPTLFEYLPKDALLIVDESHVTVPQLHGMYKGDASRKNVLSEYGFRLPACKDNRPLKFEEWDALRPQTIFVSATPGPWEIEHSHGVVIEQVIRPTGLIDPVCIVRPTAKQVDDLLFECHETVKKGYRILVTTLTKKMAEALSEYLSETGLKTRYVHSDIDTLERIEIIRDLRLGVFDVLIGINLLREGLDIPECALVAILDADKEGYLRSKTSLTQTIGRAARNVEGRAILYADRITGSMQAAMEETSRRRERQQAYNAANGITPETVKKSISDILQSVYEKDHMTIEVDDASSHLVGKKLKTYMVELDKRMRDAASNLDFEEAAKLRDELLALEAKELGLKPPTPVKQQKSSWKRRR